MASINLLEPYFNVSVDARPSNYLINHISWPDINEIVNWSEIRLIRNTSGFPQNINDGVQIFSELSDSIIVTVNNTASTALYLANPVATFTYTGGGTQVWPSTAKDYLYYNAISQNATSGSGSGAKFDIVRSKTDGSIKSVTLNSGGEGYAVGNTITISKADIGYNSTNSPAVTDITITVSTLGNPSGGLKSAGFTVTQPGKTYLTTGTYGDTATTASYVSGVASVTTGNATGKGATFKVVRNLSGVYTVTLVSSGSGYKTGDVLRIPGNLIEGRSSTTVLGQTTDWHVFDDGTSTGASTNPGSGVVGSNIYIPYSNATKIATQYPKYYYSVFIKYTIDTKANGAADTVVKWRKIGEASSLVVTDGSLKKTDGTIVRQSTLNNVLGHLPQFYTFSGVLENKDLKAFLSLIVFHIDIYLAEIKNSFNMTDTTTIDDKLIKMYLKQLGVKYNDVNDLVNARKLLTTVVRNYKNSGSTSTLADTAEGYSGYGTAVSSGINLLPDYNTSSFLENTGAWYSDTTNITTLAWDYPVSGTVVSYANLNGASLTGVSSSGNVFTCDSTVGLLSGDKLTKGSGTGVFATGTVVTTVINETTFKVNQNPSTAFSGATVNASSNLTSGMLKVTGTGTSDVTIGLGLKRVKLASDTSTSTNIITVATSPVPQINVGDSIINPLIGNTSVSPTTGFAPNTTVTKINLSSGQVTLSANPIAVISSATELWFASAPLGDKPAAVSALVAVTPNRPYSFSIKTNAGANSTKSTVVSMKWYDINGSIISTTSSLSSPATLASPGNNSWGTAQISGVSPAIASYVQPVVTISALGTSSYWVDAASLEGPIPVLKASVSGTTVTLTTKYPNNFSANNFISVSGVGSPYDGTFTINTASSSVPYSVSYTIPASSTADDVKNLGYIASVSSNFEDARALKIVPTANRINRIINPSFETSINYWSTNYASTATASGGVYGSASLQITCSTATSAITGVYAGTNTNASNRIPVLPGLQYSFSVYVKDIDTTAQVKANIEWYSLESGGTVLSTASGTVTAISSSDWTRVSVVGYAPTSSALTTIYALPTIYTDTAVDNGKKFLIDNALFEQSHSTTVGAYFDGSYDGQNYETNRDSLWEGATNASPSHLYKNRVFNSGKLDSILADGIYYA